jgi:hypothetical protein
VGGIISGMEKSVLRFFVSSLAAFVAFAALGPISVAASCGCTIGREERDVLTTVLKSMSGGSGSVLVVESRTDSSHFARTFSLEDLLLRDAMSELPSQIKAAPSGGTVFVSVPAPIIPEIQRRELEQEYRAKASQPCRIPGLRNGSNVLFKTPTQMKEILGSDPIKGWTRFHQLFGVNAESVGLSRVAFDTEKQYALVHVSSALSENAGEGELYLLARVKGNWIIKRIFSTWAT